MARLKALPARVSSLPPRISVPAKVPDPFYESVAWREFIRAIKVQRGFVCEVPSCRKDCSDNHRGLIGDHVVERRDGGADFDPANVMLMCTACHNRKTASERGRRGRQAV